MGTETKQMMANSNLAEVLENLKSLSDEEKEKVLQELKHEVCGTPVPEGEYLTIKEVSAYLKICRTSIWQYSKMGILKPYKIGNRTLFARADIDDYLKSGKNHEEH